MTSRGPGPLVGQIRAPTLLTQGTPDTLFGLEQAIATYAALRANNCPREDDLVLRRARDVHDAAV